MITNARQIVDNCLNGKGLTSTFRKSCGLVSVAGSWVDFTMTSGNPPGNYYASTPLQGRRLDPWSGIFAGADQSPSEKYLIDLMLTTPTTGLLGAWKLCDFLLYYPFIDLDDTDPQTLDNAYNQINRYTDGLGVHAVLVAQSPTTGSGTFTFNYINEHGVEVTSPVQQCPAASTNYGNCVNNLAASTAAGPYLKLYGEDCGIRSITSFQNVVPNGGLGCLVLLKPLTTIVVTEINAPTEKNFGINTALLPRIYDSAFLGFMVGVNASPAAGLLSGRMNFVRT